MKTMQNMKQMLAALLVLAMLLSGTAMAAGAPAAPDAQTTQTDYLFLSQTAASENELEFQLSGEALAAVSAEGAKVSWTLNRLTSYANGGEDDAFHPLQRETEMYPKEPDVIDLENVPKAYANYLKISDVTTGVDTKSASMTLSFKVSPAAFERRRLSGRLRPVCAERQCGRQAGRAGQDRSGGDQAL